VSSLLEQPYFPNRIMRPVSELSIYRTAANKRNLVGETFHFPFLETNNPTHMTNEISAPLWILRVIYLKSFSLKGYSILQIVQIFIGFVDIGFDN
jgi:hypothetical protein